MGQCLTFPPLQGLITVSAIPTLLPSPTLARQPVSFQNSFPKQIPGISPVPNSAPLARLFQAPQAIIAAPLSLKGGTPAERNIEVVHLIEKRLQTTVYSHETRVDIDKGKFEFDCSGMANWILQTTAPVAYAELQAARPRVADYVRTLTAVSYDKPSPGWRRVQKIADAEPGDVIAWPTPSWYPSDVSGHMGILAAKPEKVSGGYLLRLADSTSYPHGEDTREGGTGFGFGTILVTTNPATDEGTGQGWTGRYSGNTILKTPVFVGRPLK